MRIAKSRVVNLFILLGLPKAAKWNDEILTGRVATLHELFELDMKIDEKYQKLFEKIHDASKNKVAIDIIDDTNDPAEPLIKNVDVDAELQMKPDPGPNVKRAVSESVVSVVPDVDEEIDDMDDEDEGLANKHKAAITSSTPIENNSVATDIPETEETIKTDNSQKIDDTTKIEAKPKDTIVETSSGLPVYKSKLGKAQQIRRPLFNFEMLDIPIGAELHFAKDPSKIAVVCGKKTVLYKEVFGDEPVALTNLTKTLLNLPRDVQPTGYWTYEGVTLKTLYYDKFPDTDNISAPPPNSQSTKQRVSDAKVPTPRIKYWDVFDWEMNIDVMNPVERCLVSDTLTIDGIAQSTNLSTIKVRQLLNPLVRYGIVVQNEDGTFTRKQTELK